MTISNPFSACDQGNAAGKALVTVAATPVPRHTAQAPDLDALAVIVRDEHRAVGLAASNMLKHALRAGDALILAKTQVPEGCWQQWVRKHCDLKERTDRAYRQLAAKRAELEPHRQRAAGLSIAAALRILGTGRALPVKPKPTKGASSFDALAWWRNAEPAERAHFLGSVGQSAIAAATPPSWRDDIGAASAGELARLNAHIEELQREVRQRDLTIAGLRRELGMPVDDWPDLPTSLRRLPPPAIASSDTLSLTLGSSENR